MILLIIIECIIVLLAGCFIGTYFLARRSSVFAIIPASIGILFLLSAGYTFYYIGSPGNLTPERSSEIIFSVPSGANLQIITRELFDQGIISNAFVFLWTAKALGYERNLKAGRYKLPGKLSGMELIKFLNDGSNVQIWVTIPEGLTVNEIARIFTDHSNIDAALFLELAHNKEFCYNLGIEEEFLEGYLFPETYRFEWDISERDIIKTLVNEFDKVFVDSVLEKLEASKYSLHEIVTLASIIEGEAMEDSERPYISAVFRNRLDRRIRLQADPTIQYIIPDNPRRLLDVDLQIESPYNTYLNYGLPPGPINNPGKKSLIAALFPADVDYLYFVARGDGFHTFSNTNAEHIRAKQKLNKIRRELRRRQ